MTSGQDGNGGARLRGWKEIARRLRADERTARRWEERGLPVHRVPGASRSSVFAYADELDQWLSCGGAQDPPPAPETGAARTGAPRAGRPVRRRTVVAVALATVAGLALAAWSFERLKPAQAFGLRHRPDARTAALVDEARLQNGRATPEGFHRAIDLAQQAIARDPKDADAYAELAFAEIRLPEDDPAADPRIAFEHAQGAAQRALDLDPDSWRAHSTMGFIEYGYHWNFVAAVRHFREVIRINPTRGPGHDQLGEAMLDMGDTKGALAELELASRLETSNPIYRAIYAQARYSAGDQAWAVAAWRQILADNPNLIAVREMLLNDALVHRDWAAAGAQLTEMARLRHVPPDTPAVASVARALAGGDPKIIFRTLLKSAQDQQAAGRDDNFEMARIYGLFGHTDEALAALKKALDARETAAIALRIDPLLVSVRADPRFEPLATAYGISPSALGGAP